MKSALHLADIARWTGGRLHGADCVVESVVTDSRAAGPGALFVALEGERFDGHAFAAAALAQGSAALLVAQALPLDAPQVVVADTRRALGELARGWRGQCRARVVGITGSNGKTTVKTLLGSILARHGRTHVNPGNFNNEVGLPLAVLAMPADCEFAVFEMGAGKPGDIAYLARIAGPDAGLVNNVAAAHLERMGSLQGVAETKGALYRALPADGVAVINVDDPFAGYFARLASPRRVIGFGLMHPAEVSASFDARAGADGHFRLLTPAGHADIALPLVGRHNVMNALAASGLALALGVPLAAIHAGLEAAPVVSGRLSRHVLACGAVVIDDSYNANPGSFAAAIATLAATPGEALLVMGDMKELGCEGERLHAETGALARRSGIARLYAVGELSAAAVRAFGAGARHFPDQAALVAALREALCEGLTVLVKGSRSSAMERVVHALTGNPDHPGDTHAA
ncbi:UDP-N-acetylmuramoyl-tripeptide--D-alanyl-D-alanine ligase [Dokdonella sp.]|uniref:UDP-N-acetylmuramoyl-tripeptide--D-alanyl-D- alanine ligase n=1 Tax=Dokdonella sp. TaxID=2291710 RepID=UPI0031C5FA88|nr:UDP-N-acetylmuramoyl-tripeptide--D-alanyl-D-alanine ligase [Dokdonella sp.]